MKKILFVFAAMVLCSCNNNNKSTFNKFDSPQEFNGHTCYNIIQTWSENEGLATWCGIDIVYFVSDYPIYDGMEIKETKLQEFKIVGTLKYTTVNNDIKTVPVIMLFNREKSLPYE